MPLYDYQCAKCRTRFEVRLTFAAADTARPACPKCKSRKTQRQIGSAVMRSKSSQRLTREQMEAAVAVAEAGRLSGRRDDHASHDHGE
jgi:putative FmdB family regulatory protein